MERIVRPGQNTWKTASAGSSGVLVDAADYYRAFYDAARDAERSILISGWQFDRGVPLLRGKDAPAGAEVRLLKFLDGLCAAKPQLNVYILAWDFHVAFALEREWTQRLYFRWLTNERLHFRFDETAANQGSHHQKFAVIDRKLAFVGGIDLCEARWDDRRHLQNNPLRLSHGRPSKPYHDVQAYFGGCEVADVLRELFADRWARSEGPPLTLAACDGARECTYEPGGALAMGPAEIAFSRTDPRGPGDVVREVESLFVDGIRAAQRLIYIETQYFSSRAVREALVERMKAPGAAELEIVVVLNDKPEAFKEEVAVGLRQAKTLIRLTTVAREAGVRLGLYFSLCAGSDDERPSTYIHTKLMVVDDRFLTVGSANLTNRSLGVDTELHASWETNPAGIEAVRVSLLAEHAGLGDAEAAMLGEARGLVDRLDELTRRPNARLKSHAIASEAEKKLMNIVDPSHLPFDPEDPDFDDSAEA